MMRHVARRTWILGLFVFAACGGSQALQRQSFSCQKPTTIVVTTEGLRSTDGEVRVALYSSSDGFPSDPAKALQRGTAAFAESTASYTFDPVPCANYAVSVLHDEDGNGEMKTDFLGRPKEGWGVSNDARGTFGPPSFDDAVFAAEAETTRVVVHLEY
jgi:uncharacterized protein (DUF2141 family)